MSNYTLDFESSLKEIEDQIDSIKTTGIKTGMDVSDAVAKLENQLSEDVAEISSSEELSVEDDPIKED